MPLRPGYGLPAAQVVPDDWAARHAPVAAATHGAAITLRREAKDDDGFDWDTSRTDPVQGAAYATGVHADISYEPRADAEVTTGEERQPTGLYRVAVSSHLDVHERDDVEVLACPDDPLLRGRHLRVEQVLLGGHRFERDLLCVLLPRTTT